VKALPAPILAESALWPILAGREVVVPDAFAARIVLRSHEEIERRLVAEIAQRRYSAIILEFDPESAEGRGMYENAHFGARVIAAIRSSYALDRQVLPNAFLFVPATPTKVDRARMY